MGGDSQEWKHLQSGGVPRPCQPDGNAKALHPRHESLNGSGGVENTRYGMVSHSLKTRDDERRHYPLLEAPQKVRKPRRVRTHEPEEPPAQTVVVCVCSLGWAGSCAWFVAASSVLCSFCGLVVLCLAVGDNLPLRRYIAFVGRVLLATTCRWMCTGVRERT